MPPPQLSHACVTPPILQSTHQERVTVASGKAGTIPSRATMTSFAPSLPPLEAGLRPPNPFNVEKEDLKWFLELAKAPIFGPKGRGGALTVRKKVKSALYRV